MCNSNVLAQKLFLKVAMAKRKSFTVDEDARVAVLKGCMTEAQAGAWPLDPQVACQGYASFVKQYLSMGEHTKPETKAAVKIAFPSLTEADSKKLLNGLNDVKFFLKKKWKNLKSGEKTDSILLSLMKALFQKEELDSPAQVAGKPAEGCASSSKPAEGCGEVPKLPVKAGLVIASIPTSQESEDVTDVVPISSVPEVPASMLLKAAKDLKRPAAQSARPATKKPATKTSKRCPAKPAKASSSSSLEPAKARTALVIADKNVWVPSLSFGYLKATYASEKAYIVHKPEKAAKPSCLVNVSVARGKEQTEIMRKLLEMASQASLAKADVVTFKTTCWKHTSLQRLESLQRLTEMFVH